MTINFDKLLEDFRAPSDASTFSKDEFLFLLEDVYKDFSKNRNVLDAARVLLEGIDKLSLDKFNGIAEPPLTELVWGSASPDVEGEEVSMDARTMLEGFLSKINTGGVDTLEARLKALEAFYNKSTKTGKTIGGSGSKQAMRRAKINPDASTTGERRENISMIMNYLVFFKTLTRILQNFGASPAGFTFESFIAVLLGGEQVPTGNQTIADLTTGSGKPISLKLLTESAPNVKGSMRDLINDMVGAGGAKKAEKMKYVVCLKSLSGEGREISGEIKFYQFTFNAINMLDFLTLSTGKKTRMLFQLPLSETGEKIDLQREVAVDSLQPYYSEALADDEESEEQSELTSWWPEHYNEFYDNHAAGASTSPEHKQKFLQYLQPNGIPGNEGETSSGWQTRLRNWAFESFASEEDKGSRLAIEDEKRRDKFLKSWAANASDFTVAKNTFDNLWKTYKAIEGEYSVRKKHLKRQAKEGEIWATPEVSQEYLRSLARKDPELYSQALLKTRGYIARIQWVINKNQIETATEALGQKAFIGRLFIGIEHVAEMVDMYRGHVNENMFEIFKDLKKLTFYVQRFFSEGFQQSDASEVITASEGINEKTKTIQEEAS